MKDMVKISNLNQTFYTKDGELEVLKNINFNLMEGQILTILGPSGSGKSTILNILTKLLKPTSGDVIINGKIGYMFQKDNLLEWRNIMDNITIGLDLKSGRINNRLLCELATHKDFIKFLADIEIYVDGIATMQIQNLNALVDTVRHEIIERYRPGEDDPHLKVLQAAHISDDEYFSHMVLDDLNLIIRDIREAHKKDSESAPQTTVADELKENLEAVENFKGSRDEKLVVLYCKQLGINYKNLSDEEFRWLIRILKKSKKMSTPISQRKKR